MDFWTATGAKHHHHLLRHDSFAQFPIVAALPSPAEDYNDGWLTASLTCLQEKLKLLVVNEASFRASANGNGTFWDTGEMTSTMHVLCLFEKPGKMNWIREIGACLRLPWGAANRAEILKEQPICGSLVLYLAFLQYS